MKDFIVTIVVCGLMSVGTYSLGRAHGEYVIEILSCDVEQAPVVWEEA